MDIAVLRDLVIIIEGIVSIALLILLGVLALVVHKRLKEIGNSATKISNSVQEVVDSVKATTDSVASVSAFARSEIAEPLIKVAAIVQGVSRGIDTVMGLFKKVRGGDNCE